MDNTTGLGAAMEADYQRRKSQDLESRIQILEEQVKLLSDAIWAIQRNYSVLRAGL